MKKIEHFLSIIAVAMIFIGSCMLSSCKKDNLNNPAGDLVVYGKIFTAEDGEDSIAEAFVVKDGKFIYVGTKKEAAKYVGDKTQISDYTDKGLVIPGCTEGHGHFIGIDGVARMLPGFRASYRDLIDNIIPQQMQSNPSPFLSFGWATLDVEKFSTNDYATEVEEKSDGYPVILLDAGGHNAVCNRTALKMAGICNEQGKVMKNVRGGDIITIRDKNGNPTDIVNGYITDEVVPYVIEKAFEGRPILDDTRYLQACRNAVAELNKRGYTSYLDAYINVFDDGAAYRFLADMDKAGTLTAYVFGYYTIRSYDWGLPEGGNVPQRVSDKISLVASMNGRYTGGHINASGIKLFADGVTDTGTGWISEEYTIEGQPEDKKHGNIIWQQDELNAIAAAANAQGFPVHVHTFGDMACNAVINAFCASPSASNLKIRNSLAHVRNIQQADILRCAQNNIGIASNLIWHAGDPIEYRLYYLSIMSQELYESGYPMKSLVEAGVVVSSSTDAPCGESILGTVPNVIGVSVNGLSPDYTDVEPLNPSELLTVSQVLKCLTINGASSLGIDAERGSIKVGKYADFVVLDKDVLELEKTNKLGIFNTNVESTWFEGKKVYQK